MRVFKNLMGDGSKISADEIVYTEGSSNHVLGDVAKNGICNEIALYNTGGKPIDPNTTDRFLILTSHENGPNSQFNFIMTLFYGNKTTQNRTQIAFGYSVDRIYMRRYNQGNWTPWVEK